MAAVGTTHDQPRRATQQGQPPAPGCPRLGQLACQRSDAHARGHVYQAAWAPDRHDLQD